MVWFQSEKCVRRYDGWCVRRLNRRCVCLGNQNLFYWLNIISLFLENNASFEALFYIDERIKKCYDDYVVWNYYALRINLSFMILRLLIYSPWGQLLCVQSDACTFNSIKTRIVPLCLAISSYFLSVIVGGVKSFLFAEVCISFKRLVEMNVNTLTESRKYLCRRLIHTEIKG